MTIKKQILIASRSSKLALVQSNIIQKWFKTKYPNIKTKLNIIQTKGDKILNTTQLKNEGKNLFVKELEESLLKKTSDLAVHSLKDLSVNLDSRFCISAISPRENPADVFISNKYQNLNTLPKKAKIGTSSFRRQSQLLYHYPNIKIIPIRGNINTRLNKLNTHKLDGIILAAAGLIRLKIKELITEIIPTNIMIPAIAQGVLAIECLSSNKFIRELTKDFNHINTQICISAEREFMKYLNGNCNQAIAAYATYKNNKLNLIGMVNSINGKIRLIENQIAYITNYHEAKKLAKLTAEKIIQKGAQKILKQNELLN